MSDVIAKAGTLANTVKLADLIDNLSGIAVLGPGFATQRLLTS